MTITKKRIQAGLYSVKCGDHSIQIRKVSTFVGSMWASYVGKNESGTPMYDNIAFTLIDRDWETYLPFLFE